MTTHVSDDDMRAAMATTRPYTAVILHRGPHYDTPEAAAVLGACPPFGPADARRARRYQGERAAALGKGRQSRVTVLPDGSVVTASWPALR